MRRLAGTSYLLQSACVVRETFPHQESRPCVNCLTCPEHYVVKRGPVCSHHCDITGGQIPHEDLTDRVSCYRDGRVYRVQMAPRCPLNLRKGEGARMALASTVKIALKRGKAKALVAG